jgi:hypothetical protein
LGSSASAGPIARPGGQWTFTPRNRRRVPCAVGDRPQRPTGGRRLVHTRHVRTDHPLLLPQENGRPLDRHTVTRCSTGAPWPLSRSTAA